MYDLAMKPDPKIVRPHKKRIISLAKNYMLLLIGVWWTTMAQTIFQNADDIDTNQRN